MRGGGKKPCSTGKVQHPSREAAIIALRQVRSRARTQQRRFGVTRRAEQDIYCCPVCGGWHLTSLSDAMAMAKDGTTV